MDPVCFPSYYEAARNASALGQARYLRAIRLRLVALVVAAVGGAFTAVFGGVDVFAWVALGGFVVAVFVEIYIYATAPDRLWFEGRAATETIKSLTWRYAVGGEPFARTADPQQVRDRLGARLVEVARDLEHPAIPAPPASSAGVPSELSDVRSRAFDARRALYARGRVEHQIDWYRRRARSNARRSQQFLVATLVLELAAIVVAVLRVSGVVHVDLLGIAAAVIAGFGAWSQTRQHTALASAYSITARELSLVRSELDLCAEKGWPAFVERAERAISREHTLWRASRASADLRVPQ